MTLSPISKAIAEAFGKRKPRPGMSILTYLLAGGPMHSLKVK